MPITISGSTGIAGVDGSASTPAVQGTDTNTGEFFPAADTIAWTTGGTERMRVDSSGNVGIGTTPSQKLQVAGNVMVGTTSAGAALMLQNATTYWTLEQSTSNFLIANTGTERMRIDSSGNVGIGTSSPGQKLEVAGSGMFKTGTNDFVHVFSDSGAMELCRAAGEAYIDLKSAASEDWDVRLQSIGTGGTFAIYTNGGERARFTSGGVFLVGTTSTFDVTSAATTQLSGQCAVYAAGSPNTIMSFYNSTQSARVGFIGSNGNSTSYNSGSDYRLKENVTNISDATAAVQSLRPVTFTWKVSPETGTFSGFIAHELQGVWPEAVVGEKDAMCSDGVTPDYQMVDQSKLVPLLTAALQEALAEIASLKARLTALEAK